MKVVISILALSMTFAHLHAQSGPKTPLKMRCATNLEQASKVLHHADGNSNNPLGLGNWYHRSNNDDAFSATLQIFFDMPAKQFRVLVGNSSATGLFTVENIAFCQRGTRMFKRIDGDYHEFQVIDGQLYESDDEFDPNYPDEEGRFTAFSAFKTPLDKSWYQE